MLHCIRQKLMDSIEMTSVDRNNNNISNKDYDLHYKEDKEINRNLHNHILKYSYIE